MTNPVILVEDSPTQARILADFLRDLELQVVIAPDGSAALAAVMQYNPAAVILDVNLPMMNGFQVARRLKRNAQTADIPIIMLTCLDDIAYLKQGLDSGADYYLPKDEQTAIELWKTLKSFGIVTV